MQDEHLRRAVESMAAAIAVVLGENEPTIYVYGSVALWDFRRGWSDIDMLTLTEKPIEEEQAARLVTLRQTMLARERENDDYRAFEGGMISLHAFLHGENERAVYWGTSGERMTDGYAVDSFARYQLKNGSILLRGKDVRNCFFSPSCAELRADVERHFYAIRKYAMQTGRSLYSFGWLLDIARCIYTLRTGQIIAKTKAGEWALENDLCPDRQALERALAVRKNPMAHRRNPNTLDAAEQLGDAVQRFADVLERELRCEEEP